MNKVVHIITRLDSGGSAQNTLLTCIGLNKKYKFVLVSGISLESKITDWEKGAIDRITRKAKKNGVDIIQVSSLVRRIDPIKDLTAFVSLWRLLVKEKPDIVHTHTSKAGLLGRLAAKTARVPIVVHTPHGHVFYGHFRPSVSRLFLILERFAGFITDRIIALTDGEKADYIKWSVFDENRIVTIHSGVEIHRYEKAVANTGMKKETLGIDPKALVVGTVGWLLPIKGPVYLLRAMKHVWHLHSKTILVYVGKGEMEEMLRKEVRKMGVSERVRFLGWRDDVPDIMQILDIFVLPSLNEGMGRVIVEAMAAGKPVVASKVGGIPDLVKHGRNGLLVKPGDVKGLSNAIERLIADKAMRNKMGNAGKSIVGDFGVEDMTQKIDALYSSLLEKKAAGDGG
jgi:glycosyltransferase involved in cell wall biosynthesis